VGPGGACGVLAGGAMDELIYGVVRGVYVAAGPDAAPDDRRLLVFAVDTRTHSAARLLLDLAELDCLDDAELPADAAVTPYVYALAGPAAVVAAAHARFVAQLAAAYARLAPTVWEGGRGAATPAEVAAAAETRLVGLETLTPERFADLALLELMGDEEVAYPLAVAVPLPGGWEARGVYPAEGPEDAWRPLVEALLEAWLQVETVPGRDRPWTARDVERLLNDPCYAFGLQLEPQADLVATVAAFTRSLAERPERWDLARLEAEYRALFARLEASGRFRRGPDVPPIIPLEAWLRAQLARIERLRQAEGGGS